MTDRVASHDGRPTPVIFVIDLEPDGGVVPGRPTRFDGFESTFDHLAALRPHLAAVTGHPVHYSWFIRMDPQIAETCGAAGYLAVRFRQYWGEASSKGDAIGLHPHLFRWSERDGDFIVDEADQKWVEAAVRMSFDAFKASFGWDCRVVRFGDHWLNNDTVRLLESLGVEIDLTVEPGQPARPTLRGGETHTGSLPDYTKAPRTPYVPSRDDFLKPDPTREHGLWMIPISSAQVTGWRSELLRTVRGVLTPASAPLSADYTLGLSQHAFRAGRIIEACLAAERPYLTLLMRSDIRLRWRLRRHMDATVQQVINLARTRPLAFCTPAEALALLGHLQV